MQICWVAWQRLSSLLFNQFAEFQNWAWEWGKKVIWVFFNGAPSPYPHHLFELFQRDANASSNQPRDRISSMSLVFPVGFLWVGHAQITSKGVREVSWSDAQTSSTASFKFGRAFLQVPRGLGELLTLLIWLSPDMLIIFECLFSCFTLHVQGVPSLSLSMVEENGCRNVNNATIFTHLETQSVSVLPNMSN